MFALPMIDWSTLEPTSTWLVVIGERVSDAGRTPTRASGEPAAASGH